MSRHVITPKQWELLVDSFRTNPGAFSQAAKASGLDRRTTTKAWEQGLNPHSKQGIRDMLREEQESARAALHREQLAKRELQEKDRVDARKQAVDARKTEGQIVGLARANTLQVLASSAEMVRSARALGAKVKQQIERMLADDAAAAQADTCAHCGRAPEGTPVGVALVLLEKITTIARRVNEIAMESMRMERLHLGEPMEILGLSNADDRSIPHDEAELRLRIAQQAVERSLALARARGPKEN